MRRVSIGTLVAICGLIIGILIQVVVISSCDTLVSGRELIIVEIEGSLIAFDGTTKDRYNCSGTITNLSGEIVSVLVHGLINGQRYELYNVIRLLPHESVPAKVTINNMLVVWVSGLPMEYLKVVVEIHKEY